MSNLPNEIVHRGKHGHWTGTRPGHHQEDTVDCFRIDGSAWSLRRMAPTPTCSCAAYAAPA